MTVKTFLFALVCSFQPKKDVMRASFRSCLYSFFSMLSDTLRTITRRKSSYAQKVPTTKDQLAPVTSC